MLMVMAAGFVFGYLMGLDQRRREAESLRARLALKSQLAEKTRHALQRFTQLCAEKHTPPK